MMEDFLFDLFVYLFEIPHEANESRQTAGAHQAWTNSESYESWETDYDILRFIVKTAVMAHSPPVCECMF